MSGLCPVHEVTDSGQFIVFFSFLLNGLLQQVDVHLLLSQAYQEGRGFHLGLAGDLGELLVCLLELFFSVSLQHMISLAFFLSS